MKIPKLGQLQEQITAPETATEEVSVEEDQPQEAFDYQTLKDHWDSFARKKKVAGKTQEFLILNQDFELIDLHTVKIKLNSSIQIDTIDRLKSELLPYLRHALNNHQIKLEAELELADEAKMIYTPSEKFQYLADKHPHLRKLQEKLGLDPEF